MENLKENWLTEGLVDFEYKKYVLLAYLKHVKDSFKRVELYPILSDLVLHYRNLISLRDSKSLITDRFPKELSLEHINNLEINYRKIIEENSRSPSGILSPAVVWGCLSIPRLQRLLLAG